MDGRFNYSITAFSTMTANDSTIRWAVAPNNRDKYGIDSVLILEWSTQCTGK